MHSLYAGVRKTLLDGESDGMAVDFNSSNPRVQVRTANADVFSDAQTFFTQAGTSPKLVTTSAGALEWSPHNLILQSQTVGTTWTPVACTIGTNSTAAPDGTTTAETIIEDSNDNAHAIFQDVTLVSGQSYTVTAYLKAKERTYGSVSIVSGGVNRYAILVNLSTGAFVLDNSVNSPVGTSYAIADAGGGWWRVSVTATADGATGYAQVGSSDSANPTWAFNLPKWTGDNASGMYVWGCQVNKGTVPTRYLATTTTARIGLGIDYSNGSYGLLVEPAATNLKTGSQEFDGGTWQNGSPDRVDITANSTTAPDGTTTADTIEATSGAAVHNVYSITGTTVSASTTYTASVYIKAGTATYGYIAIGSVGDPTAWYAVPFNIQTGALGTHSAGAGGTVTGSTITSIGNGWYRISVTGTVGTATDAYFNIHISDTLTPTIGNYTDYSWTAAGTENMHLWGAQLELGTVATSHIPTFAATATRARDIVSVLTSAYPHSATKNTHYVDFFAVAPTGTPIVFPWSLNDTTSNEEIYMYAPYSDGNAYMRVIDGGATQSEFIRAISYNVRNQITLAWAANDIDGVVNTNAVQTDGTATLPTVTKLVFGETSSNNSGCPLRLNRFVQVPRQVETENGNIETWRYQ